MFEETHAMLLAGRFRADGHPIDFQPISESQNPSALDAIKHFVRATCAIVSMAMEEDAVDANLIDALMVDVPGPVLASLQAIVESLEAEFRERSQRDTENLSGSIEEARQAIQRIETAARYSKMVSLNARVAAGRAGSKGAEFSALSTELKTVANSIQEAADNVRDYLSQIA